MRQEFITKAPVLYTPPPDTALRSTCSHDEADEIGEKPDPAHAKCASQAILFFRDSLRWIKRHGPLDLSRTNERHFRLVS